MNFRSAAACAALLGATGIVEPPAWAASPTSATSPLACAPADVAICPGTSGSHRQFKTCADDGQSWSACTAGEPPQGTYLARADAPQPRIASWERFSPGLESAATVMVVIGGIATIAGLVSLPLSAEKPSLTPVLFGLAGGGLVLVGGGLGLNYLGSTYDASLDEEPPVTSLRLRSGVYLAAYIGPQGAGLRGSF